MSTAVIPGVPGIPKTSPILKGLRVGARNDEQEVDLQLPKAPRFWVKRWNQRDFL